MPEYLFMEVIMNTFHWTIEEWQLKAKGEFW